MYRFMNKDPYAIMHLDDNVIDVRRRGETNAQEQVLSEESFVPWTINDQWIRVLKQREDRM